MVSKMDPIMPWKVWAYYPKNWYPKGWQTVVTVFSLHRAVVTASYLHERTGLEMSISLGEWP